MTTRIGSLLAGLALGFLLALGPSPGLAQQGATAGLSERDLSEAEKKEIGGAAAPLLEAPQGAPSA